MEFFFSLLLQQLTVELFFCQKTAVELLFRNASLFWQQIYKPFSLQTWEDQSYWNMKLFPKFQAIVEFFCRLFFPSNKIPCVFLHQGPLRMRLHCLHTTQPNSWMNIIMPQSTIRHSSLTFPWLKTSRIPCWSQRWTYVQERGLPSVNMMHWACAVCNKAMPLYCPTGVIHPPRKLWNQVSGNTRNRFWRSFQFKLFWFLQEC